MRGIFSGPSFPVGWVRRPFTTGLSKMAVFSWSPAVARPRKFGLGFEDPNLSILLGTKVPKAPKSPDFASECHLLGAKETSPKTRSSNRQRPEWDARSFFELRLTAEPCRIADSEGNMAGLQ